MLCSTAATQRSRDRIPLSATGQVQHRWQMRRIKLMKESEEGGQSVNDLDHTTLWRRRAVGSNFMSQFVRLEKHRV